MAPTKTGLELLPKYRDVSVVKRARDYLIGGQRYNRVTTALGIIERGGLGQWIKNTTLQKVEETLLDFRVQEGLREVLKEYYDAGPTQDYKEWVARLVESADKASDELRDAAADRGTAIHDEICRILSNGRHSVEDPISDEAGYALDFIADRQMSVERVEMTVWNDALRIAGTCDAIGRDPAGRLCLWDWKSGSGPWWQMALQLGAYATMIGILTGEYPEAAYVVKLRADKYEVYEIIDLADAEDAFITATQLYRASSVKRWRQVK